MFYHGKIKEIVTLSTKVIAGKFERDYAKAFEQTFSSIVTLQMEYAALRRTQDDGRMNPRQMGKDTSYYHERLIQLRYSIESQKLMAIGFVLKLADKIPLNLCKPNTERKCHGSVLDTLENAV
uniref:Uncharacterized protein n=1 Tax=Myoviridae sp. ctxjh1 TaxID=2826714 RepID=A0A8S5R1J2_9CAUD|nr:MAG TPA: hypothetical protein [Myoviridae sp. ctxjh1]